MEKFKLISYHVFFGNINGLILENIYNQRKRNEYLTFVKKEKINYIFPQDNDMSLLTIFQGIEYLTIPEDAENIESLYALSSLRGIEICADHLTNLSLEKFSNLEFLSIIGHPKDINVIKFKDHIKRLYCNNWNYENLENLFGFNNLESLMIDGCRRLKSLKGLVSLKHLENLRAIYCLKLVNIEALKYIKGSLKTLEIMQCNKVSSFSVVAELNLLQDLVLISGTSMPPKILNSVSFINNLKELKTFVTDYTIMDFDLTPLLKLEHAELIKYHNQYNLKDEDLPKKYVIVKTPKGLQTKFLKELEGGKNNANIIWGDK